MTLPSNMRVFAWKTVYVVVWFLMGKPILIELSGRRFGKWTVIACAGKTPPSHIYHWHCVCDCGTEGIPSGGDLRSGKSTRCRSCHITALHAARITHGKSGTRLHGIWKNMRRRCLNPADKRFSDYGARGITLCPEWHEFPPFETWAMATGCRDDLTIERVDNDIGYSPDNCTWATKKAQQANRRITKKSPDGVPWVEVAVSNGVPATTYYSRIREGWPHENAATAPPRTPHPLSAPPAGWSKTPLVVGVRGRVVRKRPSLDAGAA